jgi:xylan 1,4-beta-xylosidase
MIQNPILKGFNPDPSILRVDDDYYIATSTFEWFPGVQIHHSKDMVNWRIAGHALTNKEQINLTGVMASGGVWAPSLTYNQEEGLFYLCYTIVYNRAGDVFHLDNYIVTSKKAEGPYSSPIYINSSGFDPSLFHDTDGRKWVVNLEWDFRENYSRPGVIVLQEYCSVQGKLIDKPKRIYSGGTDMGCLEAPNLYKRNGFYYLMAAEGGTGYGHGVTMARSRTIDGPFEADPFNPIITSSICSFNERAKSDFLKTQYYNPHSTLQKSGHGSLVKTQNGRWYVAHLCARPLMPQMRSTLGRETALQEVEWTEEGWLRLCGGGNQAKLEVNAPGLSVHDWPADPEKDDFELPLLGVNWNSLRIPIDKSWCDLQAKPGYLRLRGQESLFSVHSQSLIARRIQAFHVRIETKVEFEPKYFQQMAGLTCFYDHMTHYFLRIYFSESEGGKCLGIIVSDCGIKSELTPFRVRLPNDKPIYLRAEINCDLLQFYYSLNGTEWKGIGPKLDASKMSDEYPRNFEHFTGTFGGITCIDTYIKEATADFDWRKGKDD